MRGSRTGRISAPNDPRRWTLSRRRVLQGLAALYPALPAVAAEAALTPEGFGARGDGTSDDTAAFRRLSAALQARGGGEVELRKGATYLVGSQAPSGGQYLVGESILKAKGVERLVIRMNGATLKFRPGLRFGSFDRRGAPLPAKLPFYDASARADIGRMIEATEVGSLSVSGGRIDCNSAGALVGGLWGDSGRQCSHAGIVAYGCDKVDISDVEIVDSCLDGIMLGYVGITGRQPPKPFVLRRVRISRVGRNCLSLVGTNSTLVEDCTFEKAGAAPRQGSATLNSPPASCMDIEAEDAECRNVTIRRTKLISGPGTYTALVADSGPSRDILVEDSLLVGAVLAGKLGMRFNRCHIYGYFPRLTGGAANPADNTLISDCTFADTGPAFGYAAKQPLAIDLEGSGPGVRIVRTSISLSRTRLNLRGGVLQNVTITFATGTDTIKNRDFAMLLDQASLTDVTVQETIPAAERPADAFYVTAPKSAIRSSIVSPQSKLLWHSWTAAAGGHAGKP